MRLVNPYNRLIINISRIKKKGMFSFLVIINLQSYRIDQTLATYSKISLQARVELSFSFAMREHKTTIFFSHLNPMKSSTLPPRDIVSRKVYCKRENAFLPVLKTDHIEVILLVALQILHNILVTDKKMLNIKKKQLETNMRMSSHYSDANYV